MIMSVSLAKPTDFPQRSAYLADTANNGRELRPIGWTGPTGVTVSAHLSVTVPLDNYVPTREYAYRIIERLTWPEREDGFTGIEISIPGGMDVFKDADRALWILDDGRESRTGDESTLRSHRERGSIPWDRVCAGARPRSAARPGSSSPSRSARSPKQIPPA